MEDLSLPSGEQRQALLASLSGQLRTSGLRWSTPEKDVYAFMATIEWNHWLLVSDKAFDLFKDQNILVFPINLTALVTDLLQTTIRKILRWTVCLSVYSYTCIHFLGNQNVWAHIISRCIVPCIIQRLVSVFIFQSSSAEYFIWPTAEEMTTIQSAHATSRPADMSLADKALYMTHTSAIWISKVAAELQLRLCITAHTSPGSHRAARPPKTLYVTSSTVQLFWKTSRPSPDPVPTVYRQLEREKSHVRSFPLFIALHPTISLGSITLRLPLLHRAISKATCCTVITRTIVGCLRFRKLWRITTLGQLSSSLPPLVSS